MSEQDQEFAELLGFLQDPKVDVQQAAAEGVLTYTESPDFVDYCGRNPRGAARPLLRLVERSNAAKSTDSSDKAASSSGYKGKEKLAHAESVALAAAGVAALQALVNISSAPSVQDELVALNAPKRITEALHEGWLEGRADNAHWYAMLLTNITTSKAGQEAICKDQSMLDFMMAAYFTKPRLPPRDGYDDPLLFLGKVLVNVTAIQDGRKLLGAGEQAIKRLSALFSELCDRSRRPDMINAVKHFCLDTDCHEAIVSTDLLALMATFLYPLEKAEPEHHKALPEALRSLLEKEGATLTGDVAVRVAAAVCMMGLCRSLEGREYMRAMGGKEILLSWKNEESDESVLTNLETVLPAMTLTEEELVEEQKNLAKDSKFAGIPSETQSSSLDEPS